MLSAACAACLALIADPAPLLASPPLHPGDGDGAHAFILFDLGLAAASDVQQLRLDSDASATVYGTWRAWRSVAIESGVVVERFADDTSLGGRFALYPLGLGLGRPGLGAMLRLGGALDGVAHRRAGAVELPLRLDLEAGPCRLRTTATILRSDDDAPGVAGLARVDVNLDITLGRWYVGAMASSDGRDDFLGLGAGLALRE